ncbi:MAG: type II toxin-antitoxin system HicA family toxin [Thermodesulfobacteriota bacterium]
MNSKHRQTLQAVVSDPISGTIEWRRIESLLVALGCEVVEGRGSRVTFVKGEFKASFHRPHPGKEALKYRVVAVRDFLELLGVKP